MTNYKIKPTADNREAIKEIAERKGMNKYGYDFIPNREYFIFDCDNILCDKSYVHPLNKTFQEITFDQFKEIFDKETVSLVGRYFEALVDNATESPVIKGRFYLIEEEYESLFKFKVPHFTDSSALFVLDKANENKLYKLMPIGFDPNKVETELDKWLIETKALNLSLKELREYVFETRFDINLSPLRDSLGLKSGESLSKALYDQWNAETPPNGVPFDAEKTKGHGFCERENNKCTDNYCEENGCVARKRVLVEIPVEQKGEWQPKRGDRVLVWDDNEENTKEAIFLTYIKGAKCPIQVVMPSDNEQFLADRPFDVIEYANMKPLLAEEPKPEETDFKSKVIELVKKAICNAEFSLNVSLEEKDYNDALEFKVIQKTLSELLTKIKELD